MQEKMKKKSFGAPGLGKDAKSPQRESKKPIEFLKDPEFRRNV